MVKHHHERHQRKQEPPALNANPPSNDQSTTPAQSTHSFSGMPLHGEPLASTHSNIGTPIIQRMRRKGGVTEIDINTLSFSRVLDFLKRPDPDPDPGGVIFDANDKNLLDARANTLYPGEVLTVKTLLASPGATAEKGKRNINPGVDLVQLIDDMEARYMSGSFLGFREWIASITGNPNMENLFDKINELRAAQHIGDIVDIAESPITGTNQTADLKHGNEQIEVKTIRAPITNYTDFTGQITAALDKFTGVNPADGKIYHATIYASISNDMLAGVSKTRKGMTSTSKLNADMIKTTNISHPGGSKDLPGEDQVDKIIETLNNGAWAGADRVHFIHIFLENGKPINLARSVADNIWKRS